LDPDAVLRTKVQDFVAKGEFGFASGAKPDGTYERIWFAEPIAPEEVTFEYGVFLVRKERAKALRQSPAVPVAAPIAPQPSPVEPNEPIGPVPPPPKDESTPQSLVLRVSGNVPAESWNRFGSKLLPKLRLGVDVQARVELSCRIDSTGAPALESDIRQLLEDLGLSAQFRIDRLPE